MQILSNIGIIIATTAFLTFIYNFFLQKGEREEMHKGIEKYFSDRLKYYDEYSELFSKSSFVRGNHNLELDFSINTLNNGEKYVFR